MATEKHKELATTIKECHSNLRNLYKKHGIDVAWQEHLNDQKRLTEYADAMRQLAEIWEQNSENEALPAYSRIKWCIEYCQNYYVAGICAEKRQRELRQLAAWCPHIMEQQCDLLDQIPPLPIRVLDVGSCHNAFAKVPNFEVTAIDLSPATSEVLRGDFLQITITPLDNKNAAVQLENNVVVKINSNYFHCVIFSLLLEYMPSSEQRMVCCQKAYDALAPEGILLIITPDSQHVGKNAALMKQWQYTLATMGFMRVRFEKLACITCLAFRKPIHRELTEKWTQQQIKQPAEIVLKIPQDD